ncbi:phosphoribosylamine--glycine ligase [Neolewinella litorea]|uniref:Phosphoribosylamine--glycine ligase n=1 Tax=Neolewinella litorea TaxID=2562452 RepID=A0A4V3XLJ3_9BACT|nr:phosphoribosylamine--glycine ligase [Neolewinella litorea]THH41123.1 phosphoribosylamine--glycine ligase [Neolewinella litorea]
MNVLLLGNGAREDALAWRVSESPLCGELFIAPGNAGTERRGTNLPLDLSDFNAIRQAVLDHKIKLVICGPEEPLVRGLRDYFRTDDQLKTVYFIGPGREAARLEGSKAYAKAFMEEYGIPTAGYRRFTADDREEAAAYLDSRTPPIVLKADGLAAGKGVIILNDVGEAKRELNAMLDGKFGEASATVVVEDFLDGIEFSVFVLTDGKSYRIFPVAKDYKRIGVGDTGPNTGGMGSVSHPPFVDPDLMRKVEQRIIQPTLEGIQKRKLDYRGFIFLGLIAVEGEPFVIEYNCRLGDPETQTVMARLQTDIMQLLLEAVEGDLSTAVIRMDQRQAATVVLVSGGYPGPYEKGKTISGLDDIQDSMIFHAGTRRKNKQEIVTNGGRVLSVTSYGDTLAEALEKCYANARRVSFEGANYRSDIGFDLETA